MVEDFLAAEQVAHPASSSASNSGSASGAVRTDSSATGGFVFPDGNTFRGPDFHDGGFHSPPSQPDTKDVLEILDYANSNPEDNPDEEVIYLGEQPVQQSENDYFFKNTRKQRTISLPQLPLAKLMYYNFKRTFGNSSKTQKEDELLHLTGSSNRTLEGNKSVNLRVVHSNSPMYDNTLRNQLTPSNFNSDALFYPTNSNNLYMNNSLTTAELGPLKRFTSRSSGSSNNLPSNTSPRLKKTKVETFQTDKDGFYIYREDDVFGSNGRFIVKGLLGQGTFGKVLKCIDTASHLSNSLQGKEFVAVKVIRAVDRYREAAKTELRVLQCIKENDPAGEFQCLILKECFDYKYHICLVTGLLGNSIYDFMCSNGIARFPGSQIQAFARQLIRSVCFLHDLGIIHTDLKPENILLVDESCIHRDLSPKILKTLSTRRREASKGKRKILVHPEIKIIDFGSAVFHQEYHPPVISTRHYRAPEIVLGLGWSFPCDIWSIACVLIELVLGESLYPIHDNLEHMAMMQRINGTPIPPRIVEKMLHKAKHKLGNLPADLNTTVVKHFDKSALQLKWPEKNRKGEIITKEKSLKRVIDGCDRLDIHVSKVLKQDYGENFGINWSLSPEKNWSLISSKLLWKGDNDIRPTLTKETFLFWYWFVDLCRKMFEFDPTKRITARDALDHKWFNLGILDEGITEFNGG